MRIPKSASLLLAIALAGCQATATPHAKPALALGGAGVNPGRAAVAGGSNLPVGGGDSYYLLSLPAEPDMPKLETDPRTGQLVSTRTASVLNVIALPTMIVVQGAGLDQANLAFSYAGQAVTSTGFKLRKANMVVIKVAAGAATTGNLKVAAGASVLADLPLSLNATATYGRAVIRCAAGQSRATLEPELKRLGCVAYRFIGQDFVLAYYPLTQSYDAFAASTAGSPAIAEVSPDRRYVAAGTTRSVFIATSTTEDPRFPDQWALPKMHLPQAWQFTTGDKSVLVGVLDTGADLGHEDLKGNLWQNPAESAGDGVDNDNNGRVDDVNGWNTFENNANVRDDHGHGTAVAGVIAAPLNGLGIEGVAPSTTFLPVKALNAAGVGTTATLIDGINYAMREGAQVLNLSVEGEADDTALRSAINYAGAYNVVVVAPMGNEGSTAPRYPAAWSGLGVIAVGATDANDVALASSNRGDWQSVCAPGDNVLTTKLGGNGYAVASGTSIAAAQVTGLAALIRAVKPGYSTSLLKSLLETKALDLGAPGADPVYGHGRVDAYDSLRALFGELGINVSSQRALDYYQPLWALDKNSESGWSAERQGQSNHEWMVVDLGVPQAITSISAEAPGYYPFLFPKAFTFSVGSDGVNWTQVASESNYQPVGPFGWGHWSVPGNSARYIRMDILETRQNPDNSLYYSIVNEIAVNGDERSIPQNASSDFYGISNPTTHLTDGDPETCWISTPNQDRAQPEFCTADLGAAKTLNSLSLLSAPTDVAQRAFPQDFDLSVSSDRLHWTLVKQVRDEVDRAASWYRYEIPATVGRYVRVDVSKKRSLVLGDRSGGANHPTGFGVVLAEIDANR